VDHGKHGHHGPLDEGITGILYDLEASMNVVDHTGKRKAMQRRSWCTGKLSCPIEIRLYGKDRMPRSITPDRTFPATRESGDAQDDFVRPPARLDPHG
tara:strand:+ start:21141 stop:21434 length:294 start_codon:yes stop_codon:yes gene_type:complete